MRVSASRSAYGGVVSDWAVKRWGSTWGRRSVPIPVMALAAGSVAPRIVGSRFLRPMRLNIPAQSNQLKQIYPFP